MGSCRSYEKLAKGVGIPAPQVVITLNFINIGKYKADPKRGPVGRMRK